MEFHIGCDIVQISRFAERLRADGFLDRVFLPSETADASLSSLAGRFAAKEAACKAFGVPAGHWHAVSVSKASNGAPELRLLDPFPERAEASVSISHDGDYAFAVVAVLL